MPALSIMATRERSTSRRRRSGDRHGGGGRLAEDMRRNETWAPRRGPRDLLAAAADRHGIDRALLAAVAKVESNFDAFAVSPRGLRPPQLMPPPHGGRGQERLRPREYRGGARYSVAHRPVRKGLDLALAGYNAGEGAVDRHHGIRPTGRPPDT